MAQDYRYLLDPAGPFFCPEQLDEEQRLFRDTIHSFARERLFPLREQIESLDLDLTRSLIRECAELGLCGVDIPDEHGGLDMGYASTVLSSEFLAECGSASFMVSLGAVTGIGLLPILLYGTPEQREQWLPGIASGELMGAYCLTEPGSGSDALAARSRARLEGNEWILDGRKQYITNAGFADYFIVFAQADEGKRKGFSAFLVPRETDGLSVGREEHKMGIKGSSTGPVVFEGLRLPADHLLGQVGEGAAIALVTLDMGRIKLGLMDLGLGHLSIRDALLYTAERRQFGTRIHNFGALRGKLARMASRQLALESLCYRVIGLLEEGMQALSKDRRQDGRSQAEVLEDLALEGSMVKVLGSETHGRIVDDCLQCFGGYGFIEDYGIAGRYRDTRIDRIFEGSNEINRQVITGNLLKAALEGRFPLRRALSGWKDPGRETDPVVRARELSRGLLLGALDAAICAWGQDLALRQQAAEDLADLCITFCALDSMVLRKEHAGPALADPALFRSALVLTAGESLDACQQHGGRLLAALGEAGQRLQKLLEEMLACRARLDSYSATEDLAARLIAHGALPRS